jgi:hypothetical protein
MRGSEMRDAYFLDTAKSRGVKEETGRNPANCRMQHSTKLPLPLCSVPFSAAQRYRGIQSRALKYPPNRKESRHSWTLVPRVARSQPRRVRSSSNARPRQWKGTASGVQYVLGFSSTSWTGWHNIPASLTRRASGMHPQSIERLSGQVCSTR